jgi:chemotaxis protein MotB
VPNFESSPRVGRSQAASIFWGLVSVFFAAAACFYFWKDRENEASANKYRDQALTLQVESDNLSSQRDKLQANISETQAQLNTREEFLNDKEAKLAQEESRLEALGQQSDSQSQQNQDQAALVKKFNDTVRKLVNGDDTDVVVREGRPVLRVPASVFFAFGQATLKPSGKALLDQITQAVSSQMNNAELRIETFTDSGGEAVDETGDSLAPPPDSEGKTDEKAKPDAADKTAPRVHYENSWDLTGARAAAIEHYLRDEKTIPFQSILVVARGDFQPIIPGSENHARNRRVEITVAPAAPAFHAEDADAAKPSDAPAKSHPKKVKKAD